MIRSTLKSILRPILGKEESSASSPKAYPYRYTPEARPVDTFKAEPAPAAEVKAPEVKAPVAEAQAPAAAPVEAKAPAVEAPAAPAAAVSEAIPEIKVEAKPKKKGGKKSKDAESEPAAAEAVEAAPAQAAAPAPAIQPAAPIDDVAAGPAIDPARVEELLDEMVRPALQSDGGDIAFIKVEGVDIHVKLVGSCSTCPSSIMTMKMGVEALLREEFPNMGNLVQVE